MTFPTGSSWTRHPTPIIYPGWWAFKNLGTIGGPTTIDGTRAMAPAVVAVGSQIWLYYLAEREVSAGVTKTCILRVTAPVSDPTNFTPANIAFEFPAGWATLPSAPSDSPNAYYAVGPYHTSIVPWLSPLTLPQTDPATGAFRPWYMIMGTLGNNTGVARSMDGGVTFQLVAGANPLFPFEVYQIPTASGPVWRKTPVASKSKPYDYGGCGSACVVRSDDAVFHLFYTAAAALTLKPEDIGAVTAEIGAGHLPSGITDIGIGYAISLDGVTYTRKTAQSLGVTSPAARGSGRLVDPRHRDGPAFEYIVSRPMVFRDGSLWRMMVSSHSTDYRARSLHSTDLINWTWDISPAEGALPLGPFGSFDEHATAYPTCVRVGDTYHCYYTGNGYGHYAYAPTGIGYATASAV